MQSHFTFDNCAQRTQLLPKRGLTAFCGSGSEFEQKVTVVAPARKISPATASRLRGALKESGRPEINRLGVGLLLWETRKIVHAIWGDCFFTYMRGRNHTVKIVCKYIYLLLSPQKESKKASY